MQCTQGMRLKRALSFHHQTREKKNATPVPCHPKNYTSCSEARLLISLLPTDLHAQLLANMDKRQEIPNKHPENSTYDWGLKVRSPQGLRNGCCPNPCHPAIPPIRGHPLLLLSAGLLSKALPGSTPAPHQSLWLLLTVLDSRSQASTQADALPSFLLCFLPWLPGTCLNGSNSLWL